MFVRSLSSSVLPHVRAKGQRYYDMGAVVALTGSDMAVHAIVRGGRNYQVEIARHPDSFRASCDCLYFTDRQEICKHIWAALLVAEERGFLGAAAATPARAYLEPDLSRVPRRHVRAAVPPPAPRPQAEWQRFLTDLRHRLDAGDQADGSRAFAEGQLIYVVDVQQTLGGRGLVLHVQHRQRRKNGAWSRPRPAPIGAAAVDTMPDPEDREIVSRLIGALDGWEYAPAGAYYTASQTGRATYLLVSEAAVGLLPRLAATGRLYLLNSGELGAEPLTWDDGPAWQSELTVADDAEDGIVVRASLVRPGEQMPIEQPVLLLEAGFLLTTAQVARFEAAGTFGWLTELRRRRTVTFPAAAADAVTEALARSGVEPSALPERLRYGTFTGTPRPFVRFARLDTPYPLTRREPISAVLQFEYDGTPVLPGVGPVAYDAQGRRVIHRDLPVEHASRDRLRALGFQPHHDPGRHGPALAIPLERFPAAVRTLTAEGWRVEAEGRLFRAPREMAMRIASGVDWFELHGEVDFGEGQTASLTELLSALKRGDGTVVLGDGTRGVLPEDWLQKYAGIAAFGKVEGDHLRFKPTQTALLDALLANQPAIAVDETFERARTALASFEGVTPLDPPPAFTGQLREYQKDALGWFAFLRRFGFGGCLADDMGLGKTVMVTALLAGRTKEAQEGEWRPSLVVLPRSLVFNWLEETRRFAPSLRVLDYTGTARDLSALGDHDLVLATYGTLKRDVAHLKDIEFDYVILDEAQAVKNPATAGAKAVRLLRGRHRLALSGTPIENHLGELWSLFEFLNPGLLGTASGFRAAAAGRGRNEPSELPILARAIRPFILRRTKEQVAPELPERNEQTIQCELEGPQRRLYDQLRTRFRESLLARITHAGINRSRIQILEALLRLRQAACHPALIDPARRSDPSAKLDILAERLAEVSAEGHKALVFSQFTSFLSLVRERLERDGIAYEYLDGQTHDRETPVARFQTEPDCRVFLISLKAGGLGLNLTAAEYVFLLDPWWNPAVEAQAIDRAHRIGQTRHVFAYRLIARDTVEEKVAELQRSKRELADAILSSDAGPISELKAEDVEWLLS